MTEFTAEWQTANTASSRLQTRGCSRSGHRSEKTLDWRRRRREGCEPAVAGESQNLIWDEGERQGVVKKWRNMAQNAVWVDCNVTAPKEWRQNWEVCGAGGCCRETEQQGRKINATRRLSVGVPQDKINVSFQHNDNTWHEKHKIQRSLLVVTKNNADFRIKKGDF